MAVHSRTTFDWVLSLTPPGGIGSTITFESGSQHKMRPSAFKLDQREDVASSRLEIRFPDATQFLDAWDVTNPLAPGTEVVLSADGLNLFTGWIYDHTFTYNADARSVVVVANDRMASLKDACVDMKLWRQGIRPGKFLLTQNDGDDTLFESIDTVPDPDEYLRPWHSEYLVPVWIYDHDALQYFRVPYSEYQVLYNIGAILFRNSQIRVMGLLDGDDTLYDLTEATPDPLFDIYADFVYFTDDDSTMISNLLREAFEYTAADGGLGWTEDTEYEIEDETTGDILNGMQWNTDEGDGDCQSFLQNLYDNPKIGLAPSYWIRDFNGNGQVTAKLVTQESRDAEAKDIDLIMDAQFPSPIPNIYTRAVLVNNEPTRELLSRFGGMFSDEFPGVDTATTELPKMHDDPIHKGPGYLADDTARTSWGYGWVNKVSNWGLDEVMPSDILLFTCDLGIIDEEAHEVDTIHICVHWTTTGQGSEPNIQPAFHDETTDEWAYDIVQVHENMRFTVEYNLDSDGTPDPDAWFPVHPDLYYTEVDPLVSRDSWITVNGIDKEIRWLRVIINNPLYVRLADNHLFGNAWRGMFWFMTEFQVYGGSRVPGDGEELPSVQFTDDPEDPLRCMCNLAGDEIDMYRPNLLTITEATGLKYRTMVYENNDLWEFMEKDDDDCDLVSMGYKYLVTRLDSLSRENEWKVRIDPRPDVRIGDTIYSTKLDDEKTFLVHGNTIQMASGQMTHTVILSNHNIVAGEGGPCD